MSINIAEAKTSRVESLWNVQRLHRCKFKEKETESHLILYANVGFCDNDVCNAFGFG